MKKILGFGLLLTVLLFFACASQPAAAPAPAPVSSIPAAENNYPAKILEHKGTTLGQPYPAWVPAALSGGRAVESMGPYSTKYVVIAEASGKDLDGVRLAAGRFNAQATIAQQVSTRVSDSFAGAQVGDKDKLEGYMQRVVKSVASATFSGFTMESEWWVKLQNFDADGKPTNIEYRIIQLWTIDKTALKKQLDNMLEKTLASEPEQTAPKQEAVQAVQKAMYEGF